MNPTGSARRSKRVSGRRRRGRSPTGSNERSDRDGHVRANCTRQACMLRQRASLSPSLLAVRTVSYLCTYADVYIYIYVYEYENGRCAEATLRHLFLSLFIRQVEPSASLFI